MIKSYSFALGVIQLFQYLTKEKKEFILSKQLLRSGTSIGANAEEATAFLSRKKFIAKLQISYKEARETHYLVETIA